jgi:RNA polymerase sigma factor (TIGR02999 family)
MLLMADEAAGHTLQPTALVHEAWLLMGGDAQPQWQNRAHFFAAAAEAMRRVLIDRARTKRAARRGGGWERVDLDTIDTHRIRRFAQSFQVYRCSNIRKKDPWMLVSSGIITRWE